MADTNQLQTTLTSVANDGIKQPGHAASARSASLIYIASSERGRWLVLACLAIVPLSRPPVRYVGKKLDQAGVPDADAARAPSPDSLTENLRAAKEVRAFGLEDRRGRAGSRTHDRALIRLAAEDRQVCPGPDARD